MFEIIISLLISSQTLEPNFKNDPATETYQIIKLDSSRPDIGAKAALIADLNSNKILYSKNSLTKLPIASLTKLMTALIIVSEHDLNEIVTVPTQATQIGGASINLTPNQEITIENLLKSILIQSGNDAAVTLAIHNAGTIENFVNKMNSKATELNLRNTSFANPMGFDDPNNYSTVQDLYYLAKTVYSYPEIQVIANTSTETIYSIDKSISHKLINTNLILDSYLNIGGLKTGTTPLAGGCFIGITKQTQNPKLSIVLGSTNRFLDTKIMIDWAKNTFIYKQ
jgi:serine-type D-Ala-D-Ala carboxypeptidase (penicillin-binding protein 5/6)